MVSGREGLEALMYWFCLVISQHLVFGYTRRCTLKSRVSVIFDERFCWKYEDHSLVEIHPY